MWPSLGMERTGAQAVPGDSSAGGKCKRSQASQHSTETAPQMASCPSPARWQKLRLLQDSL